MPGSARRPDEQRLLSKPPNLRQASGRRAEQAVADWLEARGFQILRRNLRLGHLEIDIVARKDDLAIMVEVRTRGKGALEGPFASIASGKKRMHLLNAADRLWRLHLSKMSGIERMRIDVAAVRFENDDAVVDYVPGALTR